MTEALESRTMTTVAELPRYKCHKEVWALKIKEVQASAGIGLNLVLTLVPNDERYPPFPVDSEYVSKHEPKPGGYYVLYKDGYASFSPAEAFEEGYTLVA